MPMLVLNGAHRVEAVLELKYDGAVSPYDGARERVVLHVLHGADADIEAVVALVRRKVVTWDSGYGETKVVGIRFDSIEPVKEVPAHGTVVLA